MFILILNLKFKHPCHNFVAFRRCLRELQFRNQMHHTVPAILIRGSHSDMPQTCRPENWLTRIFHHTFFLRSFHNSLFAEYHQATRFWSLKSCWQSSLDTFWCITANFSKALAWICLEMLGLSEKNVCDVLAPFVQFKKRENTHEGVLFLLKVKTLHGCFHVF